MWTREYATSAAAAPRGMPASGNALATPVAKAAAEAAWPEGNEVEVGIDTWRVIGT